MNRRFTFTNWQGAKLRFKVTRIEQKRGSVFFEQYGQDANGNQTNVVVGRYVYRRDSDTVYHRFGSLDGYEVGKSPSEQVLYNTVRKYLE